MATRPVPTPSEPSELPEPPEIFRARRRPRRFGRSAAGHAARRSDRSPPDEPEGSELTLGEHLNEIRQRLTVAVLTLVLTTVITLVFASTILDYLLEPGRQALPEFRPIYTELLGFIGAYIKISLMLGLAGAMPVIVYQIYAFIHPGLTRAERKWIMPIVGLATVAFACGGAFAFFIGWPPALTFLLNFGQDIADPQVRINNYIDMLTRFVIWTGIIFELPLFLMGPGRHRPGELKEAAGHVALGDHRLLPPGRTGHAVNRSGHANVRRRAHNGPLRPRRRPGAPRGESHGDPGDRVGPRRG